MSVRIWYRHEGKQPEVVDSFSTRKMAEAMLFEYAMAYGCVPGQHRYGKDKIWVGRKDEEPKDAKA